MGGGIIHAEGVLGLLAVEEGYCDIIIHAAGVRVAFPSSVPKAAVNANLAAGVGACEFVAEVIEVSRAGPQFHHFFNHR